MTAIDYAQNAAVENRLGLHYSGLPTRAPSKSITCRAKMLSHAVESAKLG
jgi:hypothetical protein